MSAIISDHIIACERGGDDVERERGRAKVEFKDGVGRGRATYGQNAQRISSGSFRFNLFSSLDVAEAAVYSPRMRSNN